MYLKTKKKYDLHRHTFFSFIHVLNEEELKAFYVRFENRWGSLFLALLFNLIMDILVSQEKEISRVIILIFSFL